MFDFINSVTKTSRKDQNDLFANGSSTEDITGAFQQELAKAIADSQNVQPVLAGADACVGAFDKMDSSGDGNLSHDEAIAALMPIVGDQDVAERIYGVLDPKGEGQVGEDRFNQCLDTVIKVTTFEAHLSIMEMSQASASGVSADETDFQGVVDGLRNQDGISGQAVGTGGLSMDDFWMKLMEELDKNRKGQGSAPAQAEDGSTAQVAATASGGQVSMQTATYAEASISVETVSANLGAVFSAVA